MAKPPPGTTAAQQAAGYGIVNMRRHLLLCAGPDCVESPRGEAAWGYLKKRLAELRLDQAPTYLFRTRCHCLRICTQGPIVVVQPDGVWYHSADPPVIERILQEHILSGCVVKEYVFAEQALDAGIGMKSSSSKDDCCGRG
jgi:(2Fe-2S) ferredoxin